MDTNTFVCKHFNALSLDELYAAFVLRQKVFVVEQNCPYIDADGRDQESYHLMFWEDGDLEAYARILPKGVSYDDYCSIGRVVTSYAKRGTGLGAKTMEESIAMCRKFYPNVPIKISAQTYAREFYTKFGFEPTGDNYLEDDIPHMSMILAS